MTAQIDFYLLSDSDPMPFSCRLIEKIYHKKRHIYVHTSNQAAAHRLDDLLWTYKDISFIPHNLYGEGPEPPPPIQIGFGLEPQQQRYDILLNFAPDIPAFYTKFKRVLEIIANEETALAQGRENYKYYRSQNCDIKTHKI